jgi:signal transduction histidine kinase
MQGSVPQRLLEFARALNRATTFGEMLELCRTEAERELGYRHAWLTVLDSAEATTLRLIDADSVRREQFFEHAATIPIDGDAMLAELFASVAPVVVEDARTDPRTNKDLVERLGNRTIINVPLALLDKPFGSLGVGSFGDEGCLPPTPAALEYLTGMANQVSVAASRIRFVEQSRAQERSQRTLEGRIAQMQRLESVGELAGGVAHDFNNLLTVILSSAGMARSADDASERDENLAAIIEAAERGQSLTRQLLAMSRSQTLELRAISPSSRIQGLLPLMRRVFPATITIDVIPHHSDANIEADPTQFDQVIMNLGINARDAMPQGGRLTLELEQVVINGAFRATHPWAVPGRYVLISVTDDGIGMTPEVVARVFEPAFTTKSPRRGTGLGLSVAYGIVRQHGGLLHCYSEPGVGTTFKIYWPVSERSAADVGNKLTGPIRGGDEHILVAEDDAAVAAVVHRILERAGYRVSLVHDGAAACEAVAHNQFDLVLLDVIMPGLPTPEVLARITASRPGVRVMLTSGYTADTNVAALLRERGLQLLNKPYSPDELLRAVRRRLDQP